MSLGRAFLRHPLARLGGGLVLAMVLTGALAPWISPYDPAAISVGEVLEPPSRRHPLGTDELGRDVLSRLIWGARVSTEVGLVAVGISSLIGVTLGGMAGWWGGWVDAAVMRLVDVMLCFPSFFLILAVIALTEPSVLNIMAVIGVTSWMGMARLVRAELLSLREREFVLAARVMGASSARVLLRHLLPNAMAPVLVTTALGMAQAILIESALSFLGIGVQPPTPSWGNMLASAKECMGVAWWLSAFPGLAILLAALGYNLLGEALRDLLDPRTRRRWERPGR